MIATNREEADKDIVEKYLVWEMLACYRKNNKYERRLSKWIMQQIQY